MAEKEERIFAYHYKKHPCDGCEAKEVYDGCSCPILEEYEMSISRQDAIKKISSHLLMCDISTMDTDEIAEAALNTLLEGK